MSFFLLTLYILPTCRGEYSEWVSPEAGGDEHGVDGEGEHDVGDGEGDDEHVRGPELLPPKDEHEEDKQVQDGAHQDCSMASQNYHSNSFKSLLLLFYFKKMEKQGLKWLKMHSKHN